MHWAKCFGFMSMNVDLILLWKYFKSAFVFAVYSCEIESRLRSRFPFWVRDWYRLVSERDAECCQVQKDERSTVDDSALSMAWHRLVCHGLNSNQPLTQTLSFNAADSFAVYGLKRHFVRTHSRHGLTLPYCWSTLRTLNTPNNPFLFHCSSAIGSHGSIVCTGRTHPRVAILILILIRFLIRFLWALHSHSDRLLQGQVQY